MKTDTIADMLTRIRNGCASKNKYVRVPLTRLTKKIAHILWEEKFILSYEEYSRNGRIVSSPLGSRSGSTQGARIASPQMVSSDAMKMAKVLEPLGFKLATEKYLPIKEPIIQEPIIQEPIIGEKFSWGGTLILRLKYVKVGLERKSFIGGLQRVSKTSRREYTKVKNMPKLLGGVGRYVLSTTQGIMTDKKALKLGVGGEVLFSVYSRY